MIIDTHQDCQKVSQIHQIADGVWVMFTQICSPKDGLPSKRVVICCWVKKVHSYVGYESIVEGSYHDARMLTY